MGYENGSNLMQVRFRCCAHCDISLSHVQKYRMWKKADTRRRGKFEEENLLFNVETSEAARRVAKFTGPTRHLPVYTNKRAVIGSVPAILEVRFRDQFIRCCNECVRIFCVP